MLETTILDHLNEAILLFDKQLKLIYINSAGEILLDDSAKHLIGKTAQALFESRNPDFITKLTHTLQTQEKLIDRELPFTQFDQNHQVHFSLTPIVETDHMTAVLMELQLIDNHLRITREEQLLNQQNTSKLLIRGLAHEIKNPLGGIRGAAQLLELELTHSKLTEYTQIIVAESDRLQQLIDKMLGPNKPAQKSWMNIHQALEHVKQLLTAEHPGNIVFKTDYDPSIPEIQADMHQLIQVFLNIARNAVQALNHSGEILFRTRIKRRITIGRQCHRLCAKIDIIDNGPGIDPDIQEQIFYPMITGRAEGTGLGLSIAQSLVHQHQGFIKCNSRPGHTCFSVFLPLEL